MAAEPSPEEIYTRAEEEGRRRLDMSLLEQVATGFIAGVTIVFGIVALGAVEGAARPALGSELATVLGAAAFGIGVVFLVAGRSELFSENFFDPVAATIDEGGRRAWLRLGRLWLSILAFNLVGGGVLVALVTVPGALPPEAVDSLVHVAEEIATKSWSATLARSVLAGALITLLSYLLSAVDSAGARILVAHMVGFFLALGPFDHVVVSALHLVFAIWEGGAAVGYGDLSTNIALSTAGNVVGGVLLMTLTHTAQVAGSPDVDPV